MRVDHTSNMADLFASQGSQYQQPPDMMSFSQPATRHNNHLLNDSEESSSLSSFSNSTVRMNINR